ncbi:hypothetical protein DSCO28_13940 [Desulfosarcina ovata subsp. sediminis]|uniref:Uncharacterized protein n=1 Tax=Desulfosarcina ovata subsp. sediminis TaxID=885957 RepID=A0A5K7ZF95_9BACT|nr:hypothetical protein DSCO28_13940 [Desulfosarcina ovata subsp. sediminis]
MQKHLKHTNPRVRPKAARIAELKIKWHLTDIISIGTRHRISSYTITDIGG